MFLRRVELGIADGGYVMITGEPGTKKSVALRLLNKRLEAMRDVVVGILTRRQSRTNDFYREIRDLFGVPLQSHNRWAGFKALRAQWSEHISTTLTRPVLVLDEALGSAHVSALLALANYDGASGPLDLELSLRNTGAADFVIVTDPPLLVAGRDAGLFLVTTQPGSLVRAQAAVPFAVRYSPTSAGVHQGKLLFAYGVGSEEPALLTIDVTAIAGAGPTLAEKPSPLRACLPTDAE